MYSRSGHFESLRTDCKKDGIFMPSDNVLLTIYAVVGICLSTINLIIMSTTKNPSIFLGAFGIDSYTITGKGLGGYVILMIYMILYWVSMSMVIANNLIIFSLAFRKHIKDLEILENEIEKRLVWDMKKDTMNDFMARITTIRYVLNKSINELESFYTTPTIIGAVAIGPMINFGIWEPYCLYYLAVYIFIQMVFMYFIYRISSLKGNIIQLIRSPNIMCRYLNLINNTKNSQVRRVRFDNVPSVITSNRPALSSVRAAGSPRSGMRRMSPPVHPLMDAESPRMHSPRVLRNGSNLNDSTTPSTPSDCPSNASSIPLTTGLQFESYNGLPTLYGPGAWNYSLEAVNSNTEKLERYCPDSFHSAKSPKEIEKEQISMMEYKTLASIDWIILHQILSESWADFSLLGISFGDTSVIQKGIGLTSAIVVASSYVGSMFHF